jgi:hypothetical protein
MSISPDDKKVIEYYLKDVTRRAILQSASQDECVALFTARIGRLITSDREEWARTLELVRKHSKLLKQKEIIEMDSLHQEFTKKTAATA